MGSLSEEQWRRGARPTINRHQRQTTVKPLRRNPIAGKGKGGAPRPDAASDSLFSDSGLYFSFVRAPRTRVAEQVARSRSKVRVSIVFWADHNMKSCGLAGQYARPPAELATIPRSGPLVTIRDVLRDQKGSMQVTGAM